MASCSAPTAGNQSDLPPLHLTPVTRDRAIALDWLTRFEGAGLDGTITLATRQAAAGLPLRPARSHEALRAREDLLIRIERLLNRPQLFGYVLQIDADPGPGAVAPAHDIDQYIGRLEMCGGLAVARFPALQTRERDLLAPSASNLAMRPRVWKCRAVIPPEMPDRRVPCRSRDTPDSWAVADFLRTVPSVLTRRR